MEQKEQLEHPPLFHALPLRCNRSAPLGTKEHQNMPARGAVRLDLQNTPPLGPWFRCAAVGK